VTEHTGNLFAYPNGGARFGSTATTVLVALGAVSRWRRGGKAHVLLLLSPLAAMFVAAALGKYPYGGSARTALHLATPICLLAGDGLVALVARLLGPRPVRTWATVASLALGLVAVAAGIRDVARPWKKIEDFRCREAVERLARESRPRDRWIVFGRFGPSESAPDLREWGGSAARLRYQLARTRGDRSLEWAPDPDGLSGVDGTTRVVLYRDDERPFPESESRAYLDRVAARVGPPTAESIVAFGGSEGVSIVEFGR
jgi:hypothetical protein